MSYRHADKITITNAPETLQRGLRWQNPKRDGKRPYMVRSDSGGLHTRTEHCDTLTEARRVALARARGPGAWGEIFRWAESGVSMRAHFVASYEREVQT